VQHDALVGQKPTPKRLLYGVARVYPNLLPEPRNTASHAHALLALADGLTIQRLLGSLSHKAASAALEGQLALLLGREK
jgi:hypothetical protein